ncbi:MAG: hypothetical protein PQJ35_01565 [Sphaerochaetaceae bacterium]|nr:hypothetical protein [Sphaerochaetaceae bacterium]
MKKALVPMIVAFSFLFAACSTDAVTQSPYIVGVTEYVYGVVQHAQLVSVGEEENLIGATTNYVRLGGWGGYITGRFDHSVVNQEAEHDGYDLAIYPQGGAGNEPAVIYVMSDTNENQKADDVWYQIKGSEYDSQQTVTVRYYKNEDSEGSIFYTIDGVSDDSYILTASESYNGPSSLWWWPFYDTLDFESIEGASAGDDEKGTYISFTAVMLPDSKEFSGTSWIDIPDRFLYGYGENYGGEDYHLVPFGKSEKMANLIDISDAVDDKGDDVYLPSIDFIKIQTGVFQVCGDLNEISSEIAAVADLSMLGDEWELE